MATDYDISQLYYMVVKMYGLPVRNHLHIKKKIAELEREIGVARAGHYLTTLLKRDLRLEKGEFLPTLTDSLDPYIKRIKIEKYLTDNKPSMTGRVAEQIAEAEAKRQVQWND